MSYWKKSYSRLVRGGAIAVFVVLAGIVAGGGDVGARGMFDSCKVAPGFTCVGPTGSLDDYKCEATGGELECETCCPMDEFACPTDFGFVQDNWDECIG